MVTAGKAAVRAAVEAGYTLFDHADIYCHGECERIFGEVLRETPGLRNQLVLASKCGIRRPDDPPGTPQRYDFSAAHIQASCEASLGRLGVETIDLYLLHRPDELMEPEEVATAFEGLRRAGKVREFGVSNFTVSQVALLQRWCPMPLVVNQVEVSLVQRQAMSDGVLHQCQAERMTPMAWSPLGAGVLGAGATQRLPSQEGYRVEGLAEVLDGLAADRQVTRAAVALAWLLRHPSGMVPIVGTQDPQRIREAAAAADMKLSREEWYRLLLAARGEALP
jgi:predicted oxidoreductase